MNNVIEVLDALLIALATMVSLQRTRQIVLQVSDIEIIQTICVCGLTLSNLTINRLW